MHTVCSCLCFITCGAHSVCAGCVGAVTSMCVNCVSLFKSTVVGKRVFDERLAQILFPLGRVVPCNPNKYFGLKHYEWLCLAFSGASEYCLVGLLGLAEEESLFGVLQALRDALTYEVKISCWAMLSVCTIIGAFE